MRIAVSALSQTGGHGDSIMPNGANIRPTNSEMPHTVVDGVEDVRRAAREVLRAGADQIKVHTSGGVMSPNDEPGATGFSPDEIAAIVYEARAAGKTVMAHAQATQGIKNAVLGGISSIEHGIYLDEEVVEEMKRRGTWLVPTLVAPLWVVRRAEKDPSSVPPYAVRKAREVMADHQASFRLAVERGVRIAMGTDTGVGPHGTNAEELERMVEGGMTPMQAIVATTKIGRRVRAHRPPDGHARSRQTRRPAGRRRRPAGRYPRAAGQGQARADHARRPRVQVSQPGPV